MVNGVRSVFVKLITVIMVVFAVGLAPSIPAGAANNDVVAKVKGKTITLSKLEKAVAPYKYMYESQNVDFTSPGGQVAYKRLQLAVLRQMVAMELLSAGAKKAGVTVTAAEVDAEYKKTVSKRDGGEAALLKEIASYGWSKSDVKMDIKTNLIIDKYVKSHVAKGKSGKEADEIVTAWLTEQASRDVELLFAAEVPGQAEALKSAEKAGLEYYKKRYGAAADGARAKATDLGCHTQVDIIKDQKVVKRLSYSGGRITELD